MKLEDFSPQVRAWNSNTGAHHFSGDRMAHYDLKTYIAMLLFLPFHDACEGDDSKGASYDGADDDKDNVNNAVAVDDDKEHDDET